MQTGKTLANELIVELFDRRTLLTLCVCSLPSHINNHSELFLSEVRVNCLCLLSVAVIKHWPKATWEGKGLYKLAVPPSKESKAGTKAENMEEHSLLACFFWLLHFAFLYSPG